MRSMPEQERRFSFLPIMLLIVGLVVVAGVVLVFVPVVECEACVGIGKAAGVEWGRVEFKTDVQPKGGFWPWTCSYCSGRGVITLLRNHTEKPSSSKNRWIWEGIRKNRASTP